MAIMRNLTRRIFIVANIVVVIPFLLACANAFLHPNTWWPISLLGLIFPLLLVLVILFLIFWLFSSKRSLALISLGAMVVAWQNIHALFGFSFSSFEEKKADSAL